MQASCSFSTVVDKVHVITGLCNQQNFGHGSRGLHNDDQK